MRLVVEQRIEAADGVVALVLADADGAELPEWRPGAHIDVYLTDELTRQYSLCGDPADRTRWRIAVLREPDGRGGSAFVHDKLDAGSEVEVSAPSNNFELADAPEYLFIAGGIGITPILPMVHAAEAAGAHWRLLYGGRRAASMAFRDEIDGYGEHVTLRPEDEHGLLDLDAALGEPRDDVLVYCCGPEPLLAAVERRCAAWPSGALRVERFHAAERDDAPAGAFEVVLDRSGQTVTIPAGQSILETLEDAGVDVMSSCQEGVCGTCETAVLDGTPDHRDSLLTDDEREANDTMLICVSRALSARLTLDL